MGPVNVWVSSGFLGFLTYPKDVQVGRSIGHCKLAPVSQCVDEWGVGLDSVGGRGKRERDILLGTKIKYDSANECLFEDSFC